MTVHSSSTRCVITSCCASQTLAHTTTRRQNRPKPVRRFQESNRFRPRRQTPESTLRTSRLTRKTRLEKPIPNSLIRARDRAKSCRSIVVKSGEFLRHSSRKTRCEYQSARDNLGTHRLTAAAKAAASNRDCSWFNFSIHSVWQIGATFPQQSSTR